MLSVLSGVVSTLTDNASDRPDVIGTPTHIMSRCTDNISKLPIPSGACSITLSPLLTEAVMVLTASAVIPISSVILLTTSGRLLTLSATLLTMPA